MTRFECGLAAVKAYIELHDELAASARQMRELRKQKDTLSNTILGFMKSNEIDECALNDGKLIRKTTKRVETLKKDHIMEALKKSLGEDESEKCLVEMYSARAVEEVDSLRRTKKRSE
jgi:hypothetical protein